jgi:hypothetical protein
VVRSYFSNAFGTFLNGWWRALVMPSLSMTGPLGLHARFDSFISHGSCQ